MKKLLFVAICGLLSSVVNSAEPVDYVNPLMGTQSSFQLSTGNTYPAIGMPWGMNFWVP